jgi:hypothetical protein
MDIACEKDMFGVLTVLSQGPETEWPLIIGLLIVLPDLVAVETSLMAEYLATVVSFVIDGLVDAVPLLRW